jgi:hypothetical protein
VTNRHLARVLLPCRESRKPAIPGAKREARYPGSKGTMKLDGIVGPLTWQALATETLAG